MITLTVTYDTDTTVTITPDPVAVKRVALERGWTETILDPEMQRRIRLAQAAFLAAEPNDPDRPALHAEVQRLQESRDLHIPNPVSYEAFIVRAVTSHLEDTLINREELQAQADELHKAAKEKAGKALRGEK